MREKYESLPLTSLKEIAKARGLKGVSTMKKADIIELMLKKDEQDKAEEAKEEVKSEKTGSLILRSWTAELRRRGFLKCFRMDMDLSGAITIFRERMTSMYTVTDSQI